ncbi:DUF1997 domain-containing protein [Chloropicon primus]|uniref:DUF1997 domain-containing protein n=1 Tax=Chloropicon primus TaxID=1764295 RepID=A0A5B8MSK8_9CHLO|nr:hypothetical protein A3770_07p48980 [Chloropicon primus]UPR01597.1 DUF1997 domain-containing protein [Chloropicon primus]|mmetsp:Transcript_3516/g.9886  ORF Transcript_3516/g.9886 Transcript_3516/m.9886 type:complete len:265 (-) Transcript_3516:2164-2958(-)|eukprot:QDZ22380.1 hypothetical protein A3770_07p48980 [Chloropicon primus]
MMTVMMNGRLGPSCCSTSSARRDVVGSGASMRKRRAPKPLGARSSEKARGEELGTAAALVDERRDRKVKVAHLTAVSECEVPVDGAVGEGVEVDSYLKLPIEQYFISDPERITKVSENTFLFELPQMSFFNVWVAPAVTMSVNVEDNPAVVNIECEECLVKGSSFVEKMKINERLRIKVKTSLKEGRNLEAGPVLEAATELDVWCEVVPPFNLLPTAVLEKSCNGVLRRTLNALLKSFMVELKNDYHLWSTNGEYREERASRSL